MMSSFDPETTFFSNWIRSHSALQDFGR